MKLEDMKKKAQQLLKLYNTYKILSDSYIIEYFTNDHWIKLPSSWRYLLHYFEPPDLAHALLECTGCENRNSSVWPLSLLAFKQCCIALPLPRKNNPDSSVADEDAMQQKNKVLGHIFRKHVKPKKQHEIFALTKVIEDAFRSSGCDAVVDMGSGQGHLARALTFCCNIPVLAVECNGDLLKMAAKFDDEASYSLSKYLKKENNNEAKKLPPTPFHVEYSVPSNVQADAFTHRIREHLPVHPGSNPEPRYLITGLHACGDLSAAMIRLFHESKDIRAVVSVACCYMKLTTQDEAQTCLGTSGSNSKPDCCAALGFPMSEWMRSVEGSHLPYKSREASCHAIEEYKERLLENGDHLRMHCYRAVLESIIRGKYPELVRRPVQTIKKAYNLPFAEYARRAFDKLGLPPPEFCDEEVDRMLSQWRKVVLYFTICLMLAPTVESIILLDRMIYLKEHGIECELVSLFDPRISPRCFVIVASKDNDECK